MEGKNLRINNAWKTCGNDFDFPTLDYVIQKYTQNLCTQEIREIHVWEES